MLNLSTLIVIILTAFGTATSLKPITNFRRNNLVMVEGHSVHRVASMHRKRLVGKAFTAWSPNGRFTEGANAINGKVFSRIEAVGKNLFAFFDGDDNGKNGKGDSPIVMHVHFGMAGNWAVYMNETAPEPSKTNRLRLEYPGIVADLSAMTVQHGGIELYKKRDRNWVKILSGKTLILSVYGVEFRIRPNQSVLLSWTNHTLQDQEIYTEPKSVSRPGYILIV